MLLCGTVFRWMMTKQRNALSELEKWLAADSNRSAWMSQGLLKSGRGDFYCNLEGGDKKCVGEDTPYLREAILGALDKAIKLKI